MRKNKSSKIKKIVEEKPNMDDLTLKEERDSTEKSKARANLTARPEGDENTILIKRTLRSGQSVQFDGNVVILGDVNPGAEVIAGGNIIVMGSLRGVVHAGATGDEDATVAAFKLQPTQLRIANHITRPPDGEYGLPEQPEIAKIKDGVVMIEAYQFSQDKQMKIG